MGRHEAAQAQDDLRVVCADTPLQVLAVAGDEREFQQFQQRGGEGELLVKVRDTFVNTEEDAIGDVRENYMMSETCPTGGHHNILRNAGTIEE